MAADDGLAALAVSRAGGIDLVIAEEMSEPFGAFGLARELKILPKPPRIIILLDRAQDTWLARWSGADRWLLQPVDSFALANAATELMAPERPGRGDAARDGSAHGDAARDGSADAPRDGSADVPDSADEPAIH